MNPSKTEPTVCAIMLTADRPELAQRAVECFRAQTYPREKRLLFLMDTGADTKWSQDLWGQDNEGYFGAAPHRGKTIGELRNLAPLCSESDIIIHFDDDDYSHPNRIAEQVALLQSSGADCVGYREMLFWRETPILTGDFRRIDGSHGTEYRQPGEAWLYSNPNPGYCLGTSLCYWRKTWERKPFPATSFGEDLQFCTGLKCVGHSSLIRGLMPIEYGPTTGEYMPAPMNAGPRMIARIHAGNTSTGYRRDAMEAEARKKNPVWRRVPAWDEHCRAVME